MARLNIAILAAGAGGMYCGSCMRDSALATALRRLGHGVTLIPLYTPLRTDEPNVSVNRVFYGGVNVFLQYASGLFRHTPRFIDWLFDRPALLRWAGSKGAQTDPGKLGAFTLGILQGEQGPQVKELRRLLRFLRDEIKPQAVTLPNAMFLGAARMLRQELGGIPVVCELTGEDIFLDRLAEPFKARARDTLRERAADVTRFIATSRYYALHMAEYLQIDPTAIDVVYPGIAADFPAHAELVAQRHRPTPVPASNVDVAPRPLSVGYLARVCAEKGVDRLVEAFAILRKMPGLQHVTLRIAGYLGPADRDWFAALERRIDDLGLRGAYTFVGEVDAAGKRAFLDSIDVFSVPTAYAESKGIYVLEALARGVPVVQPDHGSFPELIAETGGGLLAPPGNPHALAAALAQLLLNPARRAALATAGHAAITRSFLDTHMAEQFVTLFERLAAPEPGAVSSPVRG